MKLKTKIILAVIAIFAFMLILTNNVQATTLETVETDTDGVLTLTNEDGSYILEATEDVYANLVIGDGENVTLNLGTYSFYSSSSEESAITVEEGGTLTLNATNDNHLSKITVEEGGALNVNEASLYMDEPIYNYGSLYVDGTITYTGEHAIVNYGTLETRIVYFNDTEKSTGYAIYNYGTILNGIHITATSVSKYGFLINEGTYTRGPDYDLEELTLYTAISDDTPMILNLKGSMTSTYLQMGFNVSASEAYKYCNRIGIENQAELSIDRVVASASTASCAVFQSTANATTSVEGITRWIIPDEFEAVIYADVDLEDSDTNVKLESDVSKLSENATLVTEELTSGTMFDTATNVLKDIVSSMKVYDITIELNGVAIQPEGNVKIYIPIPDDMDSSNLVVYRIDEDGTKTEYTVTVENGYAVIETDHFSTYVLAELASTTTTSTTTSSDELDETPKTGIEENTTIICLAIATIAIIALAIIKRK